MTSVEDTGPTQSATRILAEALAAPADRRMEIVRLRCGPDHALRDEVVALLGVAERVGGFLETPAVIAMTTGSTPDSEWVGLGAGDRVGPYLVVRRVGTGGMGDVYLAEQPEPIKRRVAIKIVKPGMDTRAVLARFRQERRTLSMIEHPGVARVYDAGSTERGLPYFVMEFVDGVPLTTYCNDNGASLTQRVNLFRQVCDAVHHAHQKGVIHRDLKPSNILVEVADAAARAKVIDFGIAKALGDETTVATLVTGAGQFIGTPEYMAPEQASGDADVRSDVFSLGVVLYELVTGALPVDRDRVRRMTGKELGEYLGSTTPKRASTVIAERLRDSPSPQSPASVPRELDWILIRCLERDPERRYASVAALSQDLARMLSHEPVEAGPPSRVYRASKFIRRNRTGVLAASIAMLALVGGTVAASVGFVRARQSQRQAQEVSDFLQRMLLTIRPEHARGHDTTLLRMMADDAEQSLDELVGVPGAEADIRLTLARVYGATNDWPKTIEHATRAEELYARLKGPRHTDTIAALDWIAVSMDARGDSEGAIRVASEALERAQQGLGDDHDTTITCMNNLGNLYLAVFRLDDAEHWLTRAYQARIEQFGLNDAGTLATMSNLASLRDRQGRFEESIELLETSLGVIESKYPEVHPQTALIVNNLATLYQTLDRYEEAEPLLIRACTLQESIYGSEHSLTLSALNNLASLYKSTSRIEQAEPLFRRAAYGLERIAGPDAFETLACKRNLGEVLGMMNRFDEAEIVLSDVVERAEASLVPSHPLNAIAPVVYTMLLSRQGRIAEAYQRLDDTWTYISSAPPPGNSARGEVLKGLVFLSRSLGFEQANREWQAMLEDLNGAD